MKRIAFFISLFLTTTAFSQVTDWTKSDKTTIFEDFFSQVAKYSHLNKDQKETIALCALDELIKKYSKFEYQNKIDIEIRRINEATLTHCSKILNISLTPPTPVVTDTPKVIATANPRKINEGNFTSAHLIGTWKDNNSKLYFKEGNSFLMKWDNGESFSSKWWIDPNKNIVIENYGTLEVQTFDGQTLVYKQLVKKRFLGKDKKVTFTAVKVD
jgi:hypothetical protein